MDVKRNQLIETIVWVGIPMLFMIVDWVYKHVFNIEYLELSILLFVVATIYKTYQKYAAFGHPECPGHRQKQKPRPGVPLCFSRCEPQSPTRPAYT